MKLWFIIMHTVLITTGCAFIYLSTRFAKLSFVNYLSKSKFLSKFAICVGMVLALFGIISFAIGYINAIVCIIYLSLIWIFTDIAFYIIKKLTQKDFSYNLTGIIASVLTISALSAGWYLNHNVWQTTYSLTTQKELPDLRIAMFADSHIGTTFNADTFAKHLKNIEKQNPDLLLVIGDYVDDDTTKENMIKSSEHLGKIKTKYGVFFVMGNHDKGYRSSLKRGWSEYDVISELKKNGVNILRDETILIDNSFYLIGRKDASERVERLRKRKSMDELTTSLDKSKYMIVLDHQPADYQNQAQSGVDLVLSGHTHGGQLFPFNKIGKLIGANDFIYGTTKINKTNFIVTSGISDWAIKFKTGTKSEFVIIDIKKDTD